jgi:hypothetical protein
MSDVLTKILKIELSNKFKDLLVEHSDSELMSENYPNDTIFSILLEVEKYTKQFSRNKRINLVNDKDEIVLSLINDKANVEQDESFIAFTNIDKFMSSDIAKSGYVDLFTEDGNYFKSGNKLCTTSPSVGFYEIKENNVKKTITICTPCYQRFDVLDVYVKYMSNYFMPVLNFLGYESKLLLSGDSEEYDAVKKYIDGNPDIIYLHHHNNLGEKKNLLLEFSKQADADFLCFIDSDDFISPMLTKQMIEVADKNEYWSAIEPFCFWDFETNNCGLFKGYEQNHSLFGWGMGSGRVFTKRLLNNFAKNPFARKNKSMDSYIREHLKATNLDVKERLVKFSNDMHLPIGLKCNENIWSYDSYKMQDIDLNSQNLSWLPIDIMSCIKNLRNDVDNADSIDSVDVVDNEDAS